MKLKFLTVCGCLLALSAGRVQAATPENLVPGQIKVGTISAPNQTNVYTFSASSDQVIYVTLLLTNGPGSGPQFFLYDPDLVQIGGPRGSPNYYYLPNLQLSKTGTYTLEVIDGGLDESFDYLLSLTVIGANNLREPGDGVEAIVPGQIAHGHISAADYDLFTFTANSNDVVYVTLLLTNGPGTGPHFYLYDPDYLELGLSRGASYYSYAPNVLLPKSGTYTIGVIDGGLDESFDYLLSLTVLGASNLREPDDGAEAILPGQITHGHISAADYDTFTFTASANDVAYVTMLLTNGPGVGPQFYLYDPDYVEIGLTSGAASYYYAPNVLLPKSGTYTIGVIDGGLDESFDYLLSLTVLGASNLREPDDGAEAILPGQITHGHISAADYDTFTFTASANDVAYVTMLLTNGPGVGPQFYLYDPDHLEIGPTSGAASYYYAPNVLLTKTGTYTIGVIDGGLDESFDYLLSLTVLGASNLREPDDGAEAILPGQITHGHISAADYDTFTFTASANDVAYVTMLLTNGPGVGPQFYLYDPDYVEIGLTSGAASYYYAPNVLLTKTGTYTIGVIDGGLDESFDYVLCLIRSSGPNFPEVGEGTETLLPGETRAAQITRGDLDAFKFHVIAGDSITLTAIKAAGLPNIYLQLFAPDGTVLSMDSTTPSARLSVDCLTQTGDYVVMVAESGLEQAFAYTLHLLQSPVVPPAEGNIQYLVSYLCTNHVIVRWETNSSGFRLESNPTVDGTNWTHWMASPHWAPVTITPSVVADHFYLDAGAVNGARFYRLNCPSCPAPLSTR